MQDQEVPRSPSSSPRATASEHPSNAGAEPDTRSIRLADHVLPSAGSPPSELVSAPPAHATIEKKERSRKYPPAFVSAEVAAVCPMPTDPARLALIQQKLLGLANRQPLKSEAALILGQHVIATRALAEAVGMELETKVYQPAETIEAAVELYLRGSYGRTIQADAYMGAQTFVYSSQSGLPRRGMHGDGQFAHGAALAQLLTGGGEAGSVIRSLFESGKIAHLALWARGMPPHFIQDFISEVCTEARRRSDDGELQPVDPRQFIDHLLVLVAHQLDREGDARGYRAHVRRQINSMPLALRIINKLVEASVQPLIFLLVSLERIFPSLRDNSPFRIAHTPEVSPHLSELRSPHAFFPLVRNQIAQSKVSWDLPPVEFSDLLGADDPWEQGRFHRLFNVANEVARSKEATGTMPTGKKTVRSFLPQFSFEEFENAYDVYRGTFPSTTDVPEQYADLIVTEDVGDAFALHIVLGALENANVLRDEDDLEAALLGLREKLFAEKYEHSRLKVSVDYKFSGTL